MKSLNVSRFILIYNFFTKNINTGLDLFISCDAMMDICMYMYIIDLASFSFTPSKSYACTMDELFRLMINLILITYCLCVLCDNIKRAFYCFLYITEQNNKVSEDQDFQYHD